MILMIVGSHVVFVVRESPRTTVENLFIGSTVTSVELGSTLLAQDQQKNMFVYAVIDFFSFFNYEYHVIPFWCIIVLLCRNRK